MPLRAFSDEVILHFHESAERPETVNLEFWRSKVREYMEPPPRCIGCQRSGRINKHCLSKVPRCSSSGGEHEWRKCPTGSSRKCANCEGSHAACATKCLARLAATRRAKIFVSGKNTDPVGGDGSPANKFRKSGPPVTNEEYRTLAPLRKNDVHTYTSVTSFRDTTVQPSTARSLQLSATQRLAAQQRTR